MSKNISVTLTLDRGAFAPEYSAVHVQLWPVGAYRQKWCLPDTCVQREQQTLWRFNALPDEGIRGEGFLVLVTGDRTNRNGQRCRVFVGDAHLTYSEKKECVVRDRCPQLIRHAQFSLQVAFSPPPLVLLGWTRGTSNHTPEKTMKEEEADRQDVDDHLRPVLPERCEMFLRGVTSGVFGAPVRVSDWYYHVCQETVDAGARPTDPLYFINLTMWFLRWRNVPPQDFVDHPEKHADVLQFVVGHAAWSQPYCPDECLDIQTRRFKQCESFNCMRWILSAERHRAGDCEDYAACIATSFYALSDLKTTPRMNPVLVALKKLAERYTCLLADALYRGKGDQLFLHAYVKLIPRSQAERLARGDAASPDEPLPALFVDTTRRSWTPDAPPSERVSRTLDLIVQYMRVNCLLDHGMAERFTWATPVACWQKHTKDMYQIDLRYYEPRERRVYAPQRLADREHHAFGLPATYLDGRGAWAERPAEPFVLTDVSASFVTEGPFKDDAKNLKVDVPDASRVRAWPPVPGLEVQPHLVPRHWEADASLADCVPVFLRECDVHDVARDYDRRVKLSEDNDVVKAAHWLEHCCRGTVAVAKFETLYAHGARGAEVSHVVLYVRARNKMLPKPLPSLLA